MPVLSRPCLIALLTFAGAHSVSGQQPTSHPTTAVAPGKDSAFVQRFTSMTTAMGPVYETMMQSVLEGTLRALDKQENIDLMAAIARRYYEALIKQGFTESEALRIVSGLGIPLLRTR